MSEELIKRRDATVEVGLTAAEVEERKQAGLINRKISIKNKKVVPVLLGNFLNVHNIIAVLILALLISSNYWYGLFFLIPLLSKILIILSSMTIPGVSLTLISPIVTSIKSKVVEG